MIVACMLNLVKAELDVKMLKRYWARISGEAFGLEENEKRMLSICREIDTPLRVGSV